MKPIHDRVLVRPEAAEEKTKGGIIIPDTAKEKPLRGSVVAVGPGNYNASGVFMPTTIKVDDVVVYSKFAGAEITVGEETLIIMRESDILATD